MSLETFDWTQIKGIQYSFHRHALSKYNDCHIHLNEALSAVIDPLPSEIFLEDPISPERATLVSDFVTRIRDAVVLDIIQLLDQAPGSFENDMEHIAQLFAESMVRYKDGNRYIPIRSTASFIKAAQKALSDGKINVEIIFSIDHWYFDKKRWTPMNFGQVSLVEPQAERTSNATPSDQQTAALAKLTNDHDAALAKLTEQLERISNKIDGNQQGSARGQQGQGGQGQGGQNQGGQNQNSLGTNNTGNPSFYNLSNLPPNVRERYDKKDSGKILTFSEMGPFAIPNPTAQDPDATIQRNYFAEGPRVVVRDGTLFDLTNNDQSKLAQREKTFLATFPKLYGEQPHMVRKWYQEVLDHCSRLNVYLHPYYLFRKEADHLRGFTIGGSDTDDLPSNIQWSIDSWSRLIFTAIRSEKVIPDSCPRMRQTMLNYQNGKGYETIYALISMSHPHHLRHPHDLITQTPRQKAGEHLESFYFRYVDFLRLRAFLNNQPGTLDNKHEVSCFIQGTLEKDALRRKTDEERDSTSAEKLAKYKSGTLLRTLQVYMDEINKERGIRRTPNQRSSVRHGNPRRHMRMRDIHPSKDNNSVASTITTKSINVLQNVGFPSVADEDDEGIKWSAIYNSAVNSIAQQPRLFDTTRECLICKQTGHAFKDCPILNNIEILKTHRIKLASYLRNMKELERNFLDSSASVSQVTSSQNSQQTSVTWADDDEYDQDSVYPADQYLDENENDTQDFYQG